MKQILMSVLGLLMIHSISAQPPAGARGARGGQSMNVGHLYGKVVEASTGKGLEAVSVQLLTSKLDTVTKKRQDIIISGMLTDKRGDFSLENLPVMATFKLRITAIGFKPIEEKENFTMKMGANGDMSQMLNNVDKDLGNIKLEPDAKQLAEVTVTASAGMLTMNMDRKVFNVDKNLTSVGGTAVDVMKNVPSVNVDIDGNVTLRNAPPQIFVDGRPTTMTLEQIPADAIQSVEIITNPSAKFDASGGGSGILNIVLKKNRKAGYNGSVRANIDSRARFGLGGDFNVKQGKINFFANGMYNQRKSVSTVSTTRTDYLRNGGVAYLSQNNGPVNNGHFAFGRAGLDYLADNRNTFTIAGTAVQGVFNTDDMINIERDTNFVSYTTRENGFRSSLGSFTFNNYSGQFSYKHNFAKSGKELTADMNYNYSKNSNDNAFQTQYFSSTNNPKGPKIQEQSLGGGTSNFFTAQTDYVNPITEKIKIEMGARAAIRNYSSFSNNNVMNPATGVYQAIPGFANQYTFKDEVYAAYTTFSQTIDKFGYQLGLRAESSKYTGDLLSTKQTFNNKFPLSLFPSVYLTEKINDRQDIQLNYSRKVNRPNFFQLIPFVDYTDSLNISKGNPALTPEFTNLLEFSYQVDLKKGNSILATIYYRNTTDLITRYQYKDKTPILNRNDSVYINTYANANSASAYGLELTSKNKITSFWDITSNVNFYNATINAANIPGSVKSQQFSWFGKINNSFKLPKNYSIQLSGDYQSKTLLPAGARGGGGGGMMFGGGQLSTANGYTRSNYGVDMAIKKDFLKNNAASLTLSMNDIFRTKLYSSHSEIPGVYLQDNERRRDPQILRLNFSYRFGKFDVSLFKRKNLKSEMESTQGAMQGVGNQ